LIIESLSSHDIDYKKEFINLFFNQSLSIKDIIEKDFLEQNNLFTLINASCSSQKVYENIITTLRTK